MAWLSAGRGLVAGAEDVLATAEIKCRRQIAHRDRRNRSEAANSDGLDCTNAGSLCGLLRRALNCEGMNGRVLVADLLQVSVRGRFPPGQKLVHVVKLGDNYA